MACPHIEEPRACWNVRCQLGGSCVNPNRATPHPTNTRPQGGAESALHDSLWAEIMRYAETEVVPNPTRLKEWAFQVRRMSTLAAPASAQEAPKERAALEEISSLLSSMFVSARAHVQGPDETVVGYTVRNGALHKIVGILASYKPVVIPSNLPTAHETITGVLCGTSSAAVQQGEAKKDYAPRKFVRWGDCRCILTKYCDGQCKPIYEDRAALASAQPKTGERD
jgi:hypothetical protein